MGKPRLTSADWRYSIICWFVDKLISRRSDCMLTVELDEPDNSRMLK